MTAKRKKHHDSALELQAQQRARRKSIGLAWEQLPACVLFWPCEPSELRLRRVEDGRTTIPVRSRPAAR